MFKMLSLLSDAKSLRDCLSRDFSGLDQNRTAGAEAYEKRLRDLEIEKQELARKCQGLFSRSRFMTKILFE